MGTTRQLKSREHDLKKKKLFVESHKSRLEVKQQQTTCAVSEGHGSGAEMHSRKGKGNSFATVRMTGPIPNRRHKPDFSIVTAN